MRYITDLNRSGQHMLAVLWNYSFSPDLARSRVKVVDHFPPVQHVCYASTCISLVIFSRRTPEKAPFLMMVAKYLYPPTTYWPGLGICTAPGDPAGVPELFSSWYFLGSLLALSKMAISSKITTVSGLTRNSLSCHI